jgi:hypothetical protein
MLTQDQFIEIFEKEVGCMYEHSNLWLDYQQNVSLDSSKKEARDFAKILSDYV